MMCIASAATCFAVAYSADIQSAVKDGGSVVVRGERSPAGSVYGGANEGSTLRRSWVTLDDTESPLALEGAGVSVSGRPANRSFGVVGNIRPRVPISAFEVRFILFDMFGGHLKSLSKMEVKDLAVGDEVTLSDMRPRWRRAGADWEASSGEVRELLTVVSFVAQVRTRAGVVWQYNEDAILQRLRELGFLLGGLQLKEESAP